MCGIAGCILPPDGTADRGDLATMAGLLHHRGPDESDLATAGPVGFAHTRLAIVDPTPAGAQPMRTPDGRWLLTYNGEIFNHMQLRERLAGDFAGHSDTETLIRLLAAFGEDAIPLCNGLYAYAAYDAERHRVLLVRDRFGVKPLYVARHQGGIWFASEIRALLAIGVPARVRVDRLRHTIAHRWANGRETLIEGIEQIGAGTVVSVDLDTLEMTEREWYHPADAVDPERAAQLARLSREEQTDALEEALRASVRRRLMADVPIGTMCSGGIDSSLVTALAREASSKVVAYNASVTEQPTVDESAWASLVADHCGIELRTVDMTAARWRADLVDVVHHHEFPLQHENTVPMSQIARLAHEDGVKALLSGEGADELFGGYDFRHADQYARYLRGRGAYGSLLRPLVDRVRRRHLTSREGLSESLRDATFKLSRRMGPARGLSLRSMLELGGGSVTSPDVAEYERGIRERALAAYAHAAPSERPLLAGLLADLGTYLPSLLNRQDKTTMLRSVETRVPFLDPAVVATALNLPLDARVRPKRKGILRDLSDRHLPPSISRRAKVGFGFNVRHYINAAASSEFLADGVLRETLGVPAEPWRRVTAAAESGELLSLWTSEIWCRLILEGMSPEQVAGDLWLDDPLAGGPSAKVPAGLAG